MAEKFTITEGIDKDLVTGFAITIEKAIEAWGSEFEEQLKLSLAEEGYSNSALSKSIRFSVTQISGGQVRFQLFFNEYGNYLDEGVRGAGGARKTTSKWKKSNNKGKIWRQKAPSSPFTFRDKRPPLFDSSGSGIEPWANKRGLNKYAVQESVFRQGIEPTYWFSKVVDEDYTEGLVEMLTEIGASQIELGFVNAIKKGTAE